jgi:predicted negative regulator of RcsB-dependent stress response
MREIIKWARQETVAAQVAAQAVLGLGVAFGWWHWTSQQTGAVMAVTASFLGFIARTQSTPTSNPKSSAGEPLFTIAQAQTRLHA